MIRQFGRFAGVGTLSTLVHVSVALALSSFGTLSAQVANLGGFVAAVVFSYVGHARFSFNVEPRHLIHGPRFIVTSLLSYLTSAFVVHVVHSTLELPFALAMVVVGAVVPLATFFLLRSWTFAKDVEEPANSRLGWIMSAGAALGLLALLWDTPVNHDTAWYLIATEKWLNGAELYRDIVEVNPPLNFYYTVPAVLISETLGVSLSNAQFMLVALLYLGVLIWCWVLLSQEEPASRTVHFVFVATALVVPFLNSIAQREHLMLLLIAPWVVGRLAQGPSRGGETTRAFVAAFGICLKPFFVIFPLAITLREVVEARSLRPFFAPSNLVFLCAGLVYVTAVAVLHPLYFTEIVPTASYVYGDYGFAAPVILAQIAEPGLILALGVLISACLLIKSADLVDILTLAAAALIVYLVQWTGYGYHFNPLISFAIISVGWVVACQDRRIGRVSRLLAVAGLVLIVQKPLERGVYFNPWTELLSRELNGIGEDSRLMVFSTSLGGGPAVAHQTGMEWASRYPALWLVPGTVNGLSRLDCTQQPEHCEALLSIEARTRDAIVADLLSARPDVLIFDFHYRYIDSPDFSWLVFLSADPRFETVLGDYVRVATGELYDLYLRDSLVD